MFSEDTICRILTNVKTLQKNLIEAVATEDQIQDFESIHGKIPDDYRWFLLNCGSGIFGSE
jgi:SMI1 / KNR4 family (SUKH-1)